MKNNNKTYIKVVETNAWNPLNQGTPTIESIKLMNKA